MHPFLPRIAIALSVFSFLDSSAVAQLVIRQGIDPLSGAKLARALAHSRLSVVDLPDLQVVDGGVNTGVTGASTASAGGTTCITNIGASPTPANSSGFRFGPGGAADSQSRTILIRGDIFNVCK